MTGLDGVLAATVFSLSVRRQARAYALLAAVGVPRRSILVTAWLHGGVVAALGGLLGVPGGLAFAAAALGAMQRWMPSDLGFDAMRLEPHPVSVAGGAILAAAFGLLAMAKALSQIGRWNLVILLRGGEEPTERDKRGRRQVVWTILALLLLAGSLALTGDGRGLLVSAGVFCGAMAFLARLLDSPPVPRLHLTWNGLFLRNLQEAAPSVMLGASLSGMAALILSVVAGRMDAPHDEDTRLLLSTSVPLAIDLGTEEGRRRLGFDEEELSASRGMRADSFLVSPGDDVSCLNPAKPVRTRFLGVGARTATAPPFPAQPHDAWAKLATPGAAEREVPALADENTLTWTLQSAVGGSIPWTGDRVARFVGVLRDSPLAREILVPEPDFRASYPGVDAPSFFVLAPSKGNEERVEKALSRTLAPLGPELRSVAEETKALRGVQQVYMAIFLALGSFGLLLGVAGAAFVGMRGALAQRSRYAILRTVGLDGRRVAFLALAPGIVSSLIGVTAGIGACLIGSPGAFAAWPIAAVCASVLLVLVVVNLLLAGSWRKDSLVEALRSE